MPTGEVNTPSDYERRALEEIAAWRNPPRTWYSSAKEKAESAWNDVTDVIRRVPGVEWTMDNVVTGLLDLTNEITQDTVWTEAVFKQFKDAGHRIENHVDIHLLDLEDVDTIAEGLGNKYTALAAAEGTATGLAGAAGIVPDLIALVSLNLRAAGEYATYCGFEVTRPEERLYALELLDQVAQPSTKAKDVTLAPAVRTATRVARTQSTQALEQMGLMNAIERAARALGLKLTGAKLAQIIPVTGAVIGGGFNAYYTSKVCRVAHFLYRERFLIQKYGGEIASAA
ncbi:MAG: hypothetical protein BMS9Abin05_0589 [Rhodothermia bacterium]|nr:MAG: hypothetical protein BMS9Abin05_0589 [Rhodothermia bacterium]